MPALLGPIYRAPRRADSRRRADLPDISSTARALGPLELRDRSSLSALVLPSATHPLHAWMLTQRLTDGSPQRAGSDAVDDHDRVEPGEEGVVEVGMQPLECRFDPFAMEVKRG